MNPAAIPYMNHVKGERTGLDSFSSVNVEYRLFDSSLS